MCFQKRSFSKTIDLFRALTTKKNELEFNDPLSHLLMAWNLISIWSLVKSWEDDLWNRKIQEEPNK